MKTFEKKLKEAFKEAGLTIGAPVLKAILAGLSEKDETADVCMKNKDRNRSQMQTYVIQKMCH